MPMLKRLKTSPVLLFGSGGAVLLLIGGLCGALLAISWLQPDQSPPSTEDIAAVTTLAKLPTPATPGRRLPDGTFCPSTPAHWQPYTIQEGDTLSELAARTNISQEIAQSGNCLTATELLAGQTIYLPPEPTPQPCPPPPPGWTVYTIQTGDTLWKLAATYGVDPNLVIQVNCLPSTDITAGKRLYLPARPTATPCLPSPPPGWGLYSVQTGDNLSTLAAERHTTPDEVKRVNCLPDENILANQPLYLPLLPTPTPTMTPLPPAPTLAPLADSAPSLALAANQPQPGQQFGAGFSPPGPEPLAYNPPGQLPVPGPETGLMGGISSLLNEKRYAPAGPNRPIPCNQRPPGSPPTGPWIDVPFLFYADPQTGRPQPQKGERVYAFACDFTDPATLKASLVNPFGVAHPLKMQFYLPPYPVLEGAMVLANGVVTWDPICTLPTGLYTLVMHDSKSQSITRTLELTHSLSGQILVVPQVAPVGSALRVYYCGFPPGKPVEIDLYYEAWREAPPPTPTPVPSTPCPPACVSLRRGDIVWRQADHREVPINDEGWAEEVLFSSPHDPPVTYCLTSLGDVPNPLLACVDYTLGSFWLYP